jgi:hypothetical protein
MHVNMSVDTSSNEALKLSTCVFCRLSASSLPLLLPPTVATAAPTAQRATCAGAMTTFTCTAP